MATERKTAAPGKKTKSAKPKAAKSVVAKKSTTAPKKAAPKPVAEAKVKTKAVKPNGRPVEIPDKKRMTIDLTGELVTLCKGEIKAAGLEKAGISPFVRKVLIAHFKKAGKAIKNEC